jgi:DNA-binding transcriptional LysR family regulator
MFDVRRLEVLAAAVRERSLSGAARALGITPSAASQAISALETQAGVELLVRQARGVVPTPAGERLALHAEAVIAQLATAERELAGAQPGTLRVAAFATAMAGLLPDAVRTFRQEFPSTQVSLVELEPEDARSALRAGEVDLVLVNHDAALAPDLEGPWRIQHIVDEPVFVAMPADHRKAPRQRVDLARLATDRWVMQIPASPCQQLTVRACAAAGFVPDVAATCGDYRSIVALVAAGIGVSLIPRLATHRMDLEGVVLRPARESLTRRINALVPEGRTDPATEAMIKEVRAKAH